MSYENNAGLSVHNHYGPRDTGYTVGKETRDGSIVQMRVDLTGESLTDLFVPPVYVDNNVVFKTAYLIVDEAFDVTGTTPLVYIGEDGLESTNGVTITGANLGTVGVVDLTSALTGEWDPASFVVDQVFVGIATSDAVFTFEGKATVVFEFLQLGKA